MNITKINQYFKNNDASHFFDTKSDNYFRLTVNSGAGRKSIVAQKSIGLLERLFGEYVRLSVPNNLQKGTAPKEVWVTKSQYEESNKTQNESSIIIIKYSLSLFERIKNYFFRSYIFTQCGNGTSAWIQVIDNPRRLTFDTTYGTVPLPPDLDAPSRTDLLKR
jgi:hypothetical protein